LIFRTLLRKIGALGRLGCDQKALRADGGLAGHSFPPSSNCNRRDEPPLPISIVALLRSDVAGQGEWWYRARQSGEWRTRRPLMPDNGMLDRPPLRCPACQNTVDIGGSCRSAVIVAGGGRSQERTRL